jgi:IMP dehydrogenase/GMP reductase
VKILDEVSRTLNEYLLVPNLTTADCTPDNVDLSVPLVRHRRGEESPLRMAVPLTSAIMGAVSSPRLAIALAQCGGLSFIHQNQPVEAQAAMVAAVKRHKAGFRFSDINIKPSATLGEVTALLESAERDVAVVTDDGSPHGLFVGLISTDDFHPRRHNLSDSVESRMRPAAGLVTAAPSISLSEANSLIWDHRLDVLPVVDEAGLLQSIVLRRDYELHKRFRNETIDADKRFRVGAGVNTHDYRERIPALVEAGADLLCIDSSDGYSVWQSDTLAFARAAYGGRRQDRCGQRGRRARLPVSGRGRRGLRQGRHRRRRELYHPRPEGHRARAGVRPDRCGRRPRRLPERDRRLRSGVLRRRAAHRLAHGDRVRARRRLRDVGPLLRPGGREPGTAGPGGRPVLQGVLGRGLGPRPQRDPLRARRRRQARV